MAKAVKKKATPKKEAEPIWLSKTQWDTTLEKTVKEMKTKTDNILGVLEVIKALPFDDRKILAKVVSEAHSKDLEKYGGGGDPDGEGYKL